MARLGFLSLAFLLSGSMLSSLALAATGKLALIQYNADKHFGDYATNMEELTGLALEAVHQGAKIVVFPEGSTYGYATAEETWARLDSPAIQNPRFKGRRPRDITQAAERIPEGRTSQYWSKFAQEHAVYVVYHLPEEQGGRYYNTVGVAEPDGRIQRYRKRDLYFLDTAYADEDDDPLVLDTPYGRFGFLICMDGQDYENKFYDEYKAMGADAVILPMDWDDDPRTPAAAQVVFAEKAKRYGIDIYASDVSPWDGTGKYEAGTGRFERNGLALPGIDVDGVSYHELAYRVDPAAAASAPCREELRTQPKP